MTVKRGFILRNLIKIISISTVFLFTLTGCARPQLVEDKINDKTTVQVDFKGIKGGLTCVTYMPGNETGMMSCDYVDFYNKYPYLKSDPIAR